ncbi:hypothetical protein [Nocardiopsis coralli]|nr:hypothetical protein [Nocardiopsis coralli]
MRHPGTASAGGTAPQRVRTAVGSDLANILVEIGFGAKLRG